MSDHGEREAAARALAAADVVGAGRDAAESAFDRVIDAPDGWWLPDGTDSATHANVREGGWIDFDEAAGLWLAHVRAPVAPDPLAGVVFTTPGAVLAWAEQAWDKVRPKPVGFAAMGVSSADGDALWSWLRTNDASGNGWPEHVGTIAAHARAQLAREAKAAPVAVTLDAMREAAKAHGYRLVHESGHDDPSAVLAALIVGASLSEDDAMTVTMALSSEEHARAGIARLRALGVTPAVLS